MNVLRIQQSVEKKIVHIECNHPDVTNKVCHKCHLPVVPVQVDKTIYYFTVFEYKLIKHYIGCNKNLYK